MRPAIVVEIWDFASGEIFEILCGKSTRKLHSF